MAGVRIQHPTERSCTFTLIDPSRPYSSPWTCPPPPQGCASTHLFKTYHLRLDESGAVIVSTTIWQRMARHLNAHGFRLANEVAEPPEQVVRVPFIPRLSRAVPPGGSH